MSSRNVKKVVRFNLNLNPKLLSKNTNEIVNTCIGKLYKQMPMSYQIGLQQAKGAAAAKNKAANEAAIKALNLKARQDNVKAGIYASEMCYEMKMRKAPVASKPKKPLRSYSQEMCCPRSYCSSAGNSRRWEKSRSTNFYPSPPPRPAKSNLNESVLQQRYANSVQSIEQAVKVTGQMHHDLLAIDKMLKYLNVTEKEKNCNNYPASLIDHNSNCKSFTDYEVSKRTQLLPPTNKTETSQHRNEENLRPSKIPNHIRRTVRDTTQYRNFQTNQTKSNKPTISNILNLRERKTNSLVVIENLRAMKPSNPNPNPNSNPHSHSNPHRVKPSKQHLTEFPNIKDKLELGSKKNFPSFPKKQDSNVAHLGTFFNELDIYKPPKPSKINRTLVCSATHF